MRGPNHRSILFVVGLGVLAGAVVLLSWTSDIPVEDISVDAQKAISLEISKKKYDTAKSRVKSLSDEFKKLKSQLQEQVSTLVKARSNLVEQIASVQAAPDSSSEEDVPVPPDADDAGELTVPEADNDDDESFESSGKAQDAATAAEHALHYTEQVASRVGDLADQSEEQAERIVDAARLTQEAKEAMQTALEQSSRIVDYNTHAAQAVAQDSGFVSTGAKTIAGYMKDIFHDARSVHAAAIYAVQHMNRDVSAADHAVSEIESDAEEASQVLDHIDQADRAATAFAQHARSSAVTAADAAKGALEGQSAAMAGGVRAVAAAHKAEAASHSAGEHAHAAAWSRVTNPPPYVHPYIPTYGGYPYPPEEEYKGEALVEAKALVEAVVALMQLLTNALDSAGDDCTRVDQILAYYQVHMARYHQSGQAIAAALSDEDLELVQKYAEVQVQPFAGDLQEAVEAASKACQIPVTAFIPDTSLASDPTPIPPRAAAEEVPAEAAAEEEDDAAPAESSKATLLASKRASLKAHVHAQAAVKRIRRAAAMAKAKAKMAVAK